MKTKFFCLLIAGVAVMTSCSKLKSGESFNQTVDGIEYNFEVIVSRMTFVRLTPVSPANLVQGDIVLPTTAQYDGVTYTVTQIGARAFRDYTGITSVKLPKTLSQIEKEAFAGCVALQEIDTPRPLSVIGDYAFDGCSALSAFSLDASISELGTGAFRGCTSLARLAFTPTFTVIPDELCCGCTSLSDIELPATVNSVGNSAFEGCISAASISIGSSLQTIGASAFAGCTAVGSIASKTPTPPACQAGTFDGIDPLIPVTVPMASVASYQSTPGWNHFCNFVGKY
ncbi:MAG: leucine-rich repeat domain-containing protein [Bacteroidales bacterium]|nr:leucine-rich repeat domain-containing protein [Bacteroidales bacterium]